jgi:CheY-like chemotaxis protein
LLVLDLNMPGMDGDQLAEELRSRYPGPHPPVLLLSSRCQIAGLAGRTPFHQLTKPLKPGELQRKLWEIFAGPNTPREALPGTTPQVQAGSEFAAAHPLRILVAEDVAVNRKVIQLFLNRLGYHPVLVSNGNEALCALKDSLYDVVLMDMQMPEMDGIAATRRIRSTPGHSKHPYIIALTAHALPEHREQALAAGMQDYLIKPIQPASLTDALARAHEFLAASKFERKW